MNYKARIRLLLSVNTYRTRLAFFVVLGGAVFIASFLATDAVLRDILRQFALTFIAVGAVDFVWDILGGDPLELQLARDFGEVDAKIENIQRSMAVLSDIIDGNIGLARIWPDRKEWQADPDAGLAAWHEWVCNANEVSIASNTLWNNWLHEDRFRKRLFAGLARGASVRLLMYDPNSDVLSLRAEDEKDPKAFGLLQMQSEIGSSLSVLAQEMETMEDPTKQRLQIRLTYKSLHLVQLIRADDRMLVALYLSGKSGGPSPTLQLQGPQTAYFATYAEQFDILWERARALSYDDLQEYVKEFKGTPRPPIEK